MDVEMVHSRLVDDKHYFDINRVSATVHGRIIRDEAEEVHLTCLLNRLNTRNVDVSVLRVVHSYHH